MPEQVIEEQEEKEEDTADKCFCVWPENWDSVQVFLRCTNSFDIGVGMTRIIYLGIKNSEIEITMRLMKIHEDKQLGILDDVSYMAGIAAQERNRE